MCLPDLSWPLVFLPPPRIDHAPSNAHSRMRQRKEAQSRLVTWSHAHLSPAMVSCISANPQTCEQEINTHVCLPLSFGVVLCSVIAAKAD